MKSPRASSLNEESDKFLPFLGAFLAIDRSLGSLPSILYTWESNANEYLIIILFKMKVERLSLILVQTYSKKQTRLK